MYPDKIHIWKLKTTFTFILVAYGFDFPTIAKRLSVLSLIQKNKKIYFHKAFDDFFVFASPRVSKFFLQLIG